MLSHTRGTSKRNSFETRGNKETPKTREKKIREETLNINNLGDYPRTLRGLRILSKGVWLIAF